jgi:hypothetical protein
VSTKSFCLFHNDISAGSSVPIPLQLQQTVLSGVVLEEAVKKLPAEDVYPGLAERHSVELLVVAAHHFKFIVDVPEVGHAGLPSSHGHWMAIGQAIKQPLEKSLLDQRKPAALSEERRISLRSSIAQTNFVEENFVEETFVEEDEKIILTRQSAHGSCTSRSRSSGGRRPRWSALRQDRSCFGRSPEREPGIPCSIHSS